MNQNKRIHAIDGIRGLSLLGILVANLLIFQYGIWGKDEIDFYNISGIDQWSYAFIKIAIEGSFLPIFTFLFGYSLIKMRDSLERKQLRIKSHLFRRSLILILFGYFHATYLWEGDILALYGVMGILLLMFVNRKAKTMLIWSIILFSFLGLSNLFGFSEEENDPFTTIDFGPFLEETAEINSHGDYTEIKDHRLNGDDPMFDKLEDEKLGIILLLLPFTIAPMFLLGMYAGKREWFSRPKKEKRMYLRGAIICLILGFILKSYSYFQHSDGALIIGEIILALGYIFLFGAFYSKVKTGKLLRPLENVGKLSLTNYIIQTVICTTIFYGYGIGLFGQLGVTWGLLLGIAIFGAQVIFSTLYLKRFRYGPLEKILRIGTYLSFSSKNKKRLRKKERLTEEPVG